MTRLKAILGYTVALLMLPLTAAVFFGMPDFEKMLVAATGLEVSPQFTGGEVVRTLVHGDYQTQIHRPVFDGLLCERKQGFVQIDWTPADRLPQRIDEPIDYDGDGQADFRIQFTPGEQPELIAPGPNVLGLEGVYRVHDAWVVRVAVANPRR